MCLLEDGIYDTSIIRRNELAKHFFKFAWMNDSDICNPPKWVQDTIWYQIFHLDGSRLSDSLYYAVRGKMLDVCPELEYDVSMLRYFIFKELLTGSGRTSDDACRLAEDLMHDFISVRSEINVPRETLDVLHRLKKYLT